MVTLCQCVSQLWIKRDVTLGQEVWARHLDLFRVWEEVIYKPGAGFMAEILIPGMAFCMRRKAVKTFPMGRDKNQFENNVVI